MTAPEKLLRELIALPSVNPGVLPAGDPRAGEKRVVEYLAATAASAGLDVEFRPVFPERSNLLIRLSPSGPVRRRLLLVPHADTVGDPAMSESLFQPRTRHGRLYGRGACDTKASVAAMLCALIKLARTPSRPAQTEIVLAVTVDEELHQSGSRALARSGLKADLAIVGEPTRLQVVTAHKGVVRLDLETRGRAAHGAHPELGRNAIELMARAVLLLQTRYATMLRRRPHPLLGWPTINVGVIHGGTQANIVPDRCVITLERRTVPGETKAQVYRELRTLLRHPHLPARLLPPNPDLPCPPMETDANQPLVRRLMGLAGQRRPAGVHYFSDASILSHAGIAAVLFGPGNIAQAHTAEEWIALSSLESGTALLSAFLDSLP